MKWVTKSDIEKVRKLRKAKKSRKEIAILTGIPYPRVVHIARHHLADLLVTRPHRSITQDEVEKARDLLAQGLNLKEIAAELDRCPGDTVQRICVLAGYTPRRSKAVLPSSYSLAAAYANGKTKRQVAAETGVDFKTVRKACKKHEIPTRPRTHLKTETIVALVGAGWSRAEIAKQFGLSRSTILTRYHRWKKKTNETLPSPSSAGSLQPSSASPSGS